MRLWPGTVEIKTRLIQQQEALTCVPYAYKGKFPTRHGTFACTSFNDKAKKVCECLHDVRATCCVPFSTSTPLSLGVYALPVSHIQNKRCRESIEN